MVGFCAPDMPNLTKLREKTGATFVAVGYDLEPAALQGIKDGYGEITLGQNPYLQGYLPILAFARYFKEGTPFPQGWVDVGTEVVDPSNVDEKIARENSPELTTEYYGKLIDEQYGDMNAIAKPFPGTAPAVDETAKNLGLVLHIRIPFTEQIAQGARDAAAKFGYEVEVVGPAGGFDATAQIGMFEALVQKGVDGIAVVAYPAETWKEPIDKAIEAGIPVLTLNVHSAESKAAAWFGQDEFGSGKLLAEQVLPYLKDKSGDIVLGVCAPGVNVLMDRVNGFIEGMKDHPEFTLQGPFDVGAEAAKNYAAWQNQLSAYPDAIAMVGFCAPDMPNLTKLREKTGATFVAVGYDLEPAALQGIKDGYGEITLGQNPYLQGYLPILAFARYFKDGTPFPQGWVDVGTEVVDPSNVDDKIARENSPEITTEYYGKLIDEQYGDMNAIAKPFPGTE